ncbi:beta-propeller fold lactonase family protein [Microbacterium sp. SLBN-146]|uniref:lactonase family protein n=1 Tax=Microbacterium sp. SLBN-146 TaxID=2768457 RepID=UPI001152090C|nr:beta-propeller fold lactonase family protein [Microbacterium sp. SLBN-146]TQJ30423.1 6-phosphogluconolactonase (cycloisomerase 2 family) [Microbacterium sp. SLBN-146]
MRFLLGGYTADMDGSADGIGMLLAGAADDHLAGGPLGFTGPVARADSPSWLSRHPSLDVIYAALEGRGAVQAFRRTGDAAYVALGAPVEVGESPCHVAVAPSGAAIIASCWGDGRVVRMPLDAAGRPHSPVALAAVGSDGTDAAEQPGIDLGAAARALRAAVGDEFSHLVPAYDEEPVAAPAAGEQKARSSRAHQTIALPGGVFATTDPGLDLVRFWRSEGDRMLPAPALELPRGTGPRHMVWHPSGHLYVVTEASCEVYVLAWSAPARSWHIVSASAVGPTLSTDAAAEIAPSRDAEFVYVGVRGSNTISTLRVREGGARLDPVALSDAGVDWPRHHVVVRDTLLVAGQRSDEVASLTLDDRTGVPGRVRFRTSAPSPTCILPLA